MDAVHYPMDTGVGSDLLQKEAAFPSRSREQEEAGTSLLSHHEGVWALCGSKGTLWPIDATAGHWPS